MPVEPRRGIGVGYIELLEQGLVEGVTDVATALNDPDTLTRFCPELKLDAPDGYKTKAHTDKSAFSMWIPEIQKAFQELGPEKSEVVVVGIESHICVTQTTLDLLREGHKVYVIADAVSSCNPQEVPVALARLRAEGAVVTTSESFLYECMGDAGLSEFKGLASLVKEYNGKTKENLQALCKF